EPTLKAIGVVSKEPAGLDATTNREVEPTKKATEVACKVLATYKEAGRKYKGSLLTVNVKVNVRTYYNGMNGPRIRIREVDRDEDVHGLGGGECHGLQHLDTCDKPSTLIEYKTL
ncbi:hypothetical protein KSS87_016863, partial [Heliosperma pusillum]